MEIEIGPASAAGRFTVRVLRSVGAGEPTTTCALDVERLLAQRHGLEDSILASSIAARRVTPAHESSLEAVGTLLFDTVFAGQVREAYRTSVAVAETRGDGVRLLLRLTAPGLAALPWEALYDSEGRNYLCRKEPLLRQIGTTPSTPTLPLEPPLRVLALIASPSMLPALDVAGERARLQEALGEQIETGWIHLEWLADASWERLHEKLLDESWHVLHFIGHGSYDHTRDEGVLAFVRPDGRPDLVNASSFADLLHEARQRPRLVVLNACLTAAESTDDLFSGTAAALVRSGINAVAAMQFAISDKAAIAFARGFYLSLAHGRAIDEAMRSGRIGILGVTRDTLEWVTPVLCVRGDDTRLFDVKPNAAPAPPTAEPDPPRVERTAPTAGPRAGREAVDPRSTDKDQLARSASDPRLTRSPSRRRRLVTIMAAVVLVTATMTVAVFIRERSSGTSVATATSTAPVTSVAPPQTLGAPGIQGVAVSPKGKHLYVTNRTTNVLSVVDTSTRNRVGRIMVGKGPTGVAVGEGRAYAVNQGSNSVTEINTVTLTPVGGAIGVGRTPLEIARVPGTDPALAYVTNSGDNSVSIIDLVRNAQIDTVTVGKTPWTVAVDATRGRAYVTNRGSRSISVINTTTHQPDGALIPVGDLPQNLAMSSADGRLYVTHHGSPHIAVIDTTTGKFAGDPFTLSSEVSDLALNPKTGRLYITLNRTGQIAVLDTAKGETVATLTVGGNPTDIAISDDGKYAYVVNSAWGTVSVIDTASNKLMGQPIVIAK